MDLFTTSCSKINTCVYFLWMSPVAFSEWKKKLLSSDSVLFQLQPLHCMHSFLAFPAKITDQHRQHICTLISALVFLTGVYSFVRIFDYFFLLYVCLCVFVSKFRKCVCMCTCVCFSAWSKQSPVKLSLTKTPSLNKPVWHHFEVMPLALPYFSFSWEKNTIGKTASASLLMRYGAVKCAEKHGCTVIDNLTAFPPHTVVSLGSAKYTSTARFI